MKINDEVRILNGTHTGELAYFLDHPVGRSNISNIQLKNGMREIQVFTSDLELVAEGEVMEKIQTNEFGKTGYVIKSSGGTVSVHHNSWDVAQNDVFLRMGAEGSVASAECVAVTGKKNIQDFIIAVAVSGGLIKEGEKLVLQSKVMIPTENGMYLLTGKGFEDRIVAIIDGKYFSPHSFVPTELTDITDDIETMMSERGSKLEPMKVRCW